MPIIIPDGELCGLQERLSNAGAAVLSEDQALHQDIRPARIALLNLMPAETMERTETQWLRYMSHSVLQIEPVLLKFDDDVREREGASRASELCRYTPLKDIVGTAIDALIVTGDNLEQREKPDGSLEPLPFEDITYAQQLVDVIDWARGNVRSTIYSCLASHFVLDYLYGLDREVGKSKIFGVYEHAVMHDVESDLTEGVDDTIRAPHSRWGNIPVEAFETTPVEVLAANEQIGWLMAQDDNQAGGRDVFIQGHPEYDRNDLHFEHVRDGNFAQDCPENYYSADGKPVLSWANDARTIHTNWIASIYRHFSGNDK
jgi:homoserine O-succinyltransferase